MHTLLTLIVFYLFFTSKPYNDFMDGLAEGIRGQGKR